MTDSKVSLGNNGHKPVEVKQAGKVRNFLHNVNLALHPAMKRREEWETTFAQFKKSPPNSMESVGVFLFAMNTRVKQLFEQGDAAAAMGLLKNVTEEAKKLGQNAVAAESLIVIARNGRRVNGNGNGKLQVTNIGLYVEALELVTSSYHKAEAWTETLVHEKTRFDEIFNDKQDDIGRAKNKAEKIEMSLSIADLVTGYSTAVALRFCERADGYLLYWHSDEKRSVEEMAIRGKIDEHSKEIRMRELEGQAQKQARRIERVRNELLTMDVNMNPRVQALVQRAKDHREAIEAKSEKQAALKEDERGRFDIDPNELHNMNLDIKKRKEMAQIINNGY